MSKLPQARRAEAWWFLGAGTLLDTLGWGQGAVSRPLLQVLNLLGQVRRGREPGEAALQESLRGGTRRGQVTRRCARLGVRT